MQARYDMCDQCIFNGATYLRFLLPHAMNTGGKLHSGERFSITGWRVRDVGDYGGSAVDITQRFHQ